MSAVDDVQYQLGLLKREPGERLEDFACRGYSMQMEVLSANCGHDLITDSSNWGTIDADTRASWMAWAKRNKDRK